MGKNAFLTCDPVEGFLARSASRNGYGYVEGNPVNWADPSGECPFCLALLWWAGTVASATVVGFTTATAYDVFINQRVGWSNLHEADWNRAAQVGRFGAEIGFEIGLTAGGGAVVGSALRGLVTVGRISKGAAFALGTAADLGLGVGYDTLVNKYSLADALISNTLFFGLGEVIGVAGKYAVNTVYQGAKRALKTADNLLLRVGQWYADTFDLSSVSMGGLPIRKDVKVPSPRFYEVLTEIELQRGSDYPITIGKNSARAKVEIRRNHFRRANQLFYESLQSDPVLLRSMQNEYPEIVQHVQPTVRGTWKHTSPTGWTWHHHASRDGILQLIPSAQHTALDRLLHPTGNRGGFEIWGVKYQ